LLVPGRGFEPLTNGLQNRCSTTELTRLRVKEVVISKGFVNFRLAENKRKTRTLREHRTLWWHKKWHSV
jgi:hypothetical protein